MRATKIGAELTGKVDPVSMFDTEVLTTARQSGTLSVARWDNEAAMSGPRRLAKGLAQNRATKRKGAQEGGWRGVPEGVEIGQGSWPIDLELESN